MKIEHPLRLLAILDDDKSVQSALRDLVEAEGMSALCFSSAEQFLRSSDRHKVGCLIADIHMPGMSGIELQAKLNDERCRMPIIFLTGRGDIPSPVSAIKSGAIDFFTKPVDGAVLLNSVEKALQWDNAYSARTNFNCDRQNLAPTPRAYQIGGNKKKLSIIG
jgi:FixJ family two-component response regulator